MSTSLGSRMLRPGTQRFLWNKDFDTQWTGTKQASRQNHLKQVWDTVLTFSRLLQLADQLRISNFTGSMTTTAEKKPTNKKLILKNYTLDFKDSTAAEHNNYATLSAPAWNWLTSSNCTWQELKEKNEKIKYKKGVYFSRSSKSVRLLYLWIQGTCSQGERNSCSHLNETKRDSLSETLP